MNEDCKKVQEALLDLAYADPAAPNGGISAAGVAEHGKDCPECRDYADTLLAIASLLPTSQGEVSSSGDGHQAATDLATEGIYPDWARLDETIERGVRMRAARERRDIALFALTATGILTAVWVPLLAWSPRAFLGVQAVGFLGIALFYLPIHVLRERKGDAS